MKKILNEFHEYVCVFMYATTLLIPIPILVFIDIINGRWHHTVESKRIIVSSTIFYTIVGLGIWFVAWLTGIWFVYLICALLAFFVFWFFSLVI